MAEDLPAPARLVDAIRFEHVSFAYPGTDRLVLNDVNLELPAGAVVAIVGENGAGQVDAREVAVRSSTSRPPAGSSIDGTPLKKIRADEWRTRLAGAFQDFFRFEFRASGTPSAWATCRAWTTSLPS